MTNERKKLSFLCISQWRLYFQRLSNLHLKNCSFFSQKLTLSSLSRFFLINITKESIDRFCCECLTWQSQSERNLSTVSTATSTRFDWSNGNGNVLFAATTCPTHTWQRNQRLFPYRFRVFAIFPPFRLSVGGFIESSELGRSFSTRHRKRRT